MRQPSSRPAPRAHPEILSPAGGPEAGVAALSFGADAVYLGLKRFSARAEAANFDLDELDAFTAYAHSLAPRRRVYAAVNTLVLESEIPALVEDLAALRDLRVDAVIVQDLGAARILRRHFPSLEVHASTQMAVHNRKGVEALARLGIRRVVTARELTLDEIRGLCDQPDVEIECFIHGAICYSYSGLCLFSSHATGRSANRGRCAYICGGSFAPPRGSGGKESRSALPFAMKDLALPHRLRDLEQAGVASFKIEGRKKSALYVAAVTDFYRRLLDGTLGAREREAGEADLRTVFSRPWTELYLSSPRQNASGEPHHVGHRGDPVGSVTEVRGTRREGALLRFVSSRKLEVHDGLQIEVPGLVRPYGFSIERLRLSGARNWQFEAGPGEVEVVLPAGHPAIPVGTAIHCASSQAVKRTYRWTLPKKGEFRTRRPLDVRARVAADVAEVTARLEPGLGAGDALESRQEIRGAFGVARDGAAAALGVRAAFERLGNTPFTLRELSLENPDSLYVAPSQWNRLRRAVTAELEAAQAQARSRETRALIRAVEAEATPIPRGTDDSRWSLKLDRLDLLDALAFQDWEGLAELVVALNPGDDLTADRLSALRDQLGRERLRLALPVVLRPWDEALLLPRIETLRSDGWERWEVANLAHWGHLGARAGDGPAAAGLDLTADWPLYAVNSSAGRELLDLGITSLCLSPEDGSENLRALLRSFGARASVVVYQNTPLFLSETCPKANLSGTCPGPEKCSFRPIDLESDFGNRVRVLSRKCRTVVVSRSPFCLSSALTELKSAGASSFRVDLQYSELTPEGARDLWRALRRGEPVPGSHEGNYRRGLL